jgi:flavin-dependent dehydrogenase
LKSGFTAPTTVKAATVVYSTGPVFPRKIFLEIPPEKNSNSIHKKYETLAGGKEREFMYAIAQNLDILPSEPTVNKIFFAPYIYGGYGWVFPKSQSLNIGIGSAFGEGLKECLETFKRQLAISGILHLKKGGLNSYHKNYFKANSTVTGIAPVSGIVNRPATEEGLVTAGDAAGLCNPVTGAGIYNAVCSAKIAAEKIFLSIQKNDRAVLLDINKEYEKMFSVSIGRALQKRDYMLKNWQNSAVPFDEVIKKSWIAFRDYWK